MILFIHILKNKIKYCILVKNMIDTEILLEAHTIKYNDINILKLNEYIQYKDIANLPYPMFIIDFFYPTKIQYTYSR